MAYRSVWAREEAKNALVIMVTRIRSILRGLGELLAEQVRAAN